MGKEFFQTLTVKRNNIDVFECYQHMFLYTLPTPSDTLFRIAI